MSAFESNVRDKMLQRMPNEMTWQTSDSRQSS